MAIEKLDTSMSQQKIGLGEKLAYGSGNMASNIVFAAISNFIAFFYTDVVGIGAAAVGTLLFVSRIFDGFSDLGMGILIDKTRSKYGKARPWLLWMAAPFGIMTVLLFTVPDIGETGQLIYVYITYNLMVTIVYTAINTPYLTMNSLITQDQHQRSVLNLFGGFMATVATIFVGVATIPFIQTLGGGTKGWRLGFLIFGAVATILFFINFFFTKERVTPSVTRSQNAVPLKLGIKALITNKYWIILLIFGIAAYINQGLMGANVYYAQYILGDTEIVGLITMAMFIPVGVLMFILAPITKRMGKRNTILIGCIVQVIGQLIVAFNPISLPIVVIGTVLKGIGMAPLLGLLFAMLADTVEYGEWKSGVRTEGLVYSAGGVGAKIGLGLGAAIVGWVLAAGGYVGGADTQSAGAISSIKFLFIYLPIILAIIQFIAIWFYKLDQQFDSILQDLQS